MSLTSLTAISPIDGRYHDKTAGLAEYFSEFALIKYRIGIEIGYFTALCELNLPQLAGIDEHMISIIEAIETYFSLEDAKRIKELEKITNHDVKAVEYFLREKFDELGFGEWKEFIHFGLTSQDITNPAVTLMLEDGLDNSYLPLFGKFITALEEKARLWKAIPMLARTHGQPASPTTVDKELKVFVERLREQLALLHEIPVSTKFGGATGNFNAHYAAYPDIDWIKFAEGLLKDFDMVRQSPTTQIEHYDHMAAKFDNLKRINIILIDFCRDVWQYISMEYFKQRIEKDEVGSSAMPHKVNPIDFENAEGNLGIANALLEHLAAKLPISRLQRDLTDSTATRNIGVPLAHMMIAVQSLQKGLGKLSINEPAIKVDLENNWAVVAEALQTILRREKYPNPYEALKGLTRTGEQITQQVLHQFIDGLEVSDEIKAEMKAITPFNYVGRTDKVAAY